MDTVTSATDGRELRSAKVKQRLRAGLRLQRQQIAAIRNKLQSVVHDARLPPNYRRPADFSRVSFVDVSDQNLDGHAIDPVGRALRCGGGLGSKAMSSWKIPPSDVGVQCATLRCSISRLTANCVAVLQGAFKQARLE
jgi:hypothetical protein